MTSSQLLQCAGGGDLASEHGGQATYTVWAPRLNQPTDLDLANELLEIEASLVE